MLEGWKQNNKLATPADFQQFFTQNTEKIESASGFKDRTAPTAADTFLLQTRTW